MLAVTFTRPLSWPWLVNLTPCWRPCLAADTSSCRRMMGACLLTEMVPTSDMCWTTWGMVEWTWNVCLGTDNSCGNSRRKPHTTNYTAFSSRLKNACTENGYCHELIEKTEKYWVLTNKVLRINFQYVKKFSMQAPVMTRVKCCLLKDWLRIFVKIWSYLSEADLH